MAKIKTDLNIGRFFYFVIMGMIILSQTVAGDTATVSVNLDAAALEKRGQLRQLKFFAAENAIKLNDLHLIEDDAPGIGSPMGIEYHDSTYVEWLHKGVMIRKDFMLDDPRAFSGYIVFDGMEERSGNEVPLHISINGHHFIRPATQYDQPFFIPMGDEDSDWDYWIFVDIPVGALRKGRNECVIWSKSEETFWKVIIASEDEYRRGSTTRLHHPNRSAKSRDGGKTWDFDKLGARDEIDGEYCILLTLDRFVPDGVYESPIIDIAGEWGIENIKKPVTITESNIQWNLDIPIDSSVELSARIGSDPVLSSNSWQPYEKVNEIGNKL